MISMRLNDKEKIGIRLNNCINPINKQSSVFIANFVLDNYEKVLFLGALLMTREILIAKKYNLPIVKLLNVLTNSCLILER